MVISSSNIITITIITMVITVRTMVSSIMAVTMNDLLALIRVSLHLFSRIVHRHWMSSGLIWKRESTNWEIFLGMWLNLVLISMAVALFNKSWSMLSQRCVLPCLKSYARTLLISPRTYSATMWCKSFLNMVLLSSVLVWFKIWLVNLCSYLYKLMAAVLCKSLWSLANLKSNARSYMNLSLRSLPWWRIRMEIMLCRKLLRLPHPVISKWL